MHHILFEESPTYPIAILIKPQALRKQELINYYVNPLSKHTNEKCISFSLDYANKSKPTATIKNAYLAKLLPALDSLGTKYLLVCDVEYFKSLTVAKKADPYYGYVLPCKVEGFEHINVVLGINYQAMHYNPNLQSKLDQAFVAISNHMQGTYSPVGTDIIQSAYYPESYQDIHNTLQELHAYDTLVCDVETFSLKHYTSGIGTIGFAWTQHAGTAFTVDYRANTAVEIENNTYGRQETHEAVRGLLRGFFENYQGKLLFHNASFDITILIYNLWMDNLLDQKGLLKGLHTLCRLFGCTQVITYLATNSCAGNKLSLKEQAQEYAGNFAEDDVNDITRIPKPQLLKYNLTDCCATWYVYNKNYPLMVQDAQEELYNDLMLPSLKTIIQMQLTGMCLDMGKVHEADVELQRIVAEALKTIESNPVMLKFIEDLRLKKWEKDFTDRKSKAKNPDKIQPKDIDTIEVVFNPNSSVQLQQLLYENLDLPILDITPTKAPATGAKTLEKLISHTDNKETVNLLTSLITYGKATKILTSFIPAFKKAPLAPNGYHYLYGSFKLGGTLSGRLSAHSPNLQQINLCLAM